MLARTHGQPATPTRLGKEIFVFVYRLQQAIKQLGHVRLMRLPFDVNFAFSNILFGFDVIGESLCEVWRCHRSVQCSRRRFPEDQLARVW
jgi:hypothetical protein